MHAGVRVIASPGATARLGMVLFFLAGPFLGASCGCGRVDPGPQRYHVKGTVTYDGQPLQRGRITFVPDAQRGTEGPAGYAIIQGGSYDTAREGGKGTVAGAIRVLITGQDLPAQEGEEQRPDLFTDEIFEVTIAPDGGSVTQDFAVERRRK